MIKCYESCDDWLDEIEGFATRRERMLEEVEHPDQAVEWLRVAWKLGAAAEREACAKIADSVPDTYKNGDQFMAETIAASRIAAAIRARRAP